MLKNNDVPQETSKNPVSVGRVGMGAVSEALSTPLSLEILFFQWDLRGYLLDDAVVLLKYAFLGILFLTLLEVLL